METLKTLKSHLKNDGWKTSLSFWDAIFSSATGMLVSGRVTIKMTELEFVRRFKMNGVNLFDYIFRTYYSI